jgi:uncharacterized protein YbjT (DUF2867 family)
MMIEPSYISVKTEINERTEMNVLVLGGRGFIGRHVVAALRAAGEAVVIGSRDPSRRCRSDRKADSIEVRRVRFEERVSPAAWRPLLTGFDVVVNCVGILRERPGETYDVVHHRSPAALREACRDAGVGRLVHVSALGLSESAKHPFLTSKLAGERALQSDGIDTIIVRPSLLDGRGGFGSIWLRRLARLPIHVVPGAAVGRIAALDVGDLGVAIARLCASPFDAGLREVELGGLDVRTLDEHLQALRGLHAGRHAWTLRVPTFIARVGARVCDLVHFSPYSLGHLELLGRDNVPRYNALPMLLGRAPRRIGRALSPGHAKPSARARRSAA